MYAINYDPTGNPISIIKEGKQIPLAPGNMDYEEFLKWNKQRSRPLDYNTPIRIIDKPEVVQTIEERIVAIEEKLKVLEVGSESVVKKI